MFSFHKLLNKGQTYPIGKLNLAIPDDMLWCFKNDSYYEINVEFWLKKICSLYSKPVFYDIGSNIGYYSVLLAVNAKMVYSFEPVKQTYQYLKKNILLNHIHNARTFKLGISDNQKSLKINLYNSSGNNSLFERKVPAGHTLKKTGEELIELDTLDSVITLNKLLPADIIKIDVEGAELLVLKGAKETILKNKPVLLFEYADSTSSDAGYSKQELLNFFKELNYHFFGIAENEIELKLISHSDFSTQTISNVIALPETMITKFESLL